MGGKSQTTGEDISVDLFVVNCTGDTASEMCSAIVRLLLLSILLHSQSVFTNSIPF